MYRYRACVCAGVVALVVLGGWGLSSASSFAASRSENDWGNRCGGWLEQGSGVTKLVVKHKDKKAEDTWEDDGPVFRSSALQRYWKFPPSFLWETWAGFLPRGCSNAVTFAAASRGNSALIGVSVAFPWGAKNSSTAKCRVLAVSHNFSAGFSCHQVYVRFDLGQIAAKFELTSP